MVRTEMKRAFCSKTFWLTCGLTLFMLAFGSSDFLPPNPNKYMGEGWSVATDIPKPWWIYYLHCFLLGQRTMISVFYPILAMIPYVISYRGDLDSGYRQLVLLKSSRRFYLCAKLLAVVSSTFVAVLLPALAWIPVCRLLGLGSVAPVLLRLVFILHPQFSCQQKPGGHATDAPAGLLL